MIDLKTCTPGLICGPSLRAPGLVCAIAARAGLQRGLKPAPLPEHG